VPERTGPGRHRRPRRSFGPAAVGVVVALMLGGLGAGAALLPESLVGAAGPSGQGGAAGAGTTLARGAEVPPADAPLPDAGLRPGPSTTPAASPSPTRAKPKPSPSRTTTRPRPEPTRTRSTATSDPTRGSDTEQQRVVDIVNRERAAGGCPAVKVNARLTEASQLHSEDQAAHNNMSHEGSDGSSPWDRARRAGYDNAIGENVAMGYRDAEAVMDGWMNSPGHRNNIMNCDARAIGVGLAMSSGGAPYWTQMFGSVA
jgi:uncharacterized protein YkwD